jgi:hypothetical protein
LAGSARRRGVHANARADGRILILEEGNRRIQAFDLKGNAVPWFSVNQPRFEIDGSFAADLDAHTASAGLVHQQFQANTTSALAAKFKIATRFDRHRPRREGGRRRTTPLDGRVRVRDVAEQDQ